MLVSRETERNPQFWGVPSTNDTHPYLALSSGFFVPMSTWTSHYSPCASLGAAHELRHGHGAVLLLGATGFQRGKRTQANESGSLSTDCATCREFGGGPLGEEKSRNKLQTLQAN